MSLTGLLIFLAIGAVAGWLGGLIMKGSGFGLLGNIIVGIVGAILGGALFGMLGISASGLLGSIITATVGAVVLLFIASLIRRA
ncbi:MAG: GlsB/YeaQ/YmgE family stress response membrane protein [Gammaproteobacteria bacterium]|nr:GlsB/YeaQ/YmgE family stress response membrane protein [Gammaproteobacteria bacterium]